MTLGFSPIRYLEAFTAVMTSANWNDRNHQPVGPGETVPEEDKPQIGFGDWMLGAKGTLPVTRSLHVGLAAATGWVSPYRDLKREFGLGWLKFDLITGACEQMPSLGLSRFATRIENGDVLVCPVPSVYRPPH